MKYLMTFIREEGQMEDATPEQIKANLDSWTNFTNETVEAGAFVAGEGLQPSASATTVRVAADGGERTVTDGPFAESKEQLGGFYLLEVTDLDEALEWAKKVPVQSGAIELRPVMDYEGNYESPPSPAQAAASS
jgi:hypothetical protein